MNESIDILIKQRLEGKQATGEWDAHIARLDASIKVQVPEGERYDGECGSAIWESRRGNINYKMVLEEVVERLRPLSNAIVDNVIEMLADLDRFRADSFYTWNVRPVLKRAPQPKADMEANLDASVEATPATEGEG